MQHLYLLILISISLPEGTEKIDLDFHMQELVRFYADCRIK